LVMSNRIGALACYGCIFIKHAFIAELFDCFIAVFRS